MSWDVPGTVLSPQGALYPWDPHLQRWDPLLGAQGASLAVSGPSQQPTALCGVPSASSGVAQQGAGELCGVGGGGGVGGSGGKKSSRTQFRFSRLGDAGATGCLWSLPGAHRLPGRRF